MDAAKKIMLSPELKDALMKKEARNKLISIGITLTAGLVGFVVDKHLDKKLMEEFDPTEETTEEV